MCGHIIEWMHSFFCFLESSTDKCRTAESHLHRPHWWRGGHHRNLSGYNLIVKLFSNSNKTMDCLADQRISVRREVCSQREALAASARVNMLQLSATTCFQHEVLMKLCGARLARYVCAFCGSCGHVPARMAIYRCTA